MKFINFIIIVVLLGIIVLNEDILVLGFKHHLQINNDRRQAFLIESFGFGVGGIMELNITNWKLSGEPLDINNKDIVTSVGFYINVTSSDSYQNIEEFSTGDNCAQDLKDNDYTITFEGLNTYKKFSIDGTNNIEGIYTLYYINCNPDTTTTFDLVLDEYNVGKDGKLSYLPIGLSPIPTIYIIFSGLFFLLLLLWVGVLLRGEGKKPNKVHHLSTAYLIIQTLSLLFESIEQHYIKTTGSPNGWNIAYYIFSFLQGSFFIVLILLIGTGWYFIKPFLSDKDKTIFVIVIPLQILANIALIMVDEEAPGSRGWVSWGHLLTTVDIICFFAILVPIIWSIKHLKDISQSDDKAAQNLQKLKLFRQLYLIVISYAYFTRIIVLLMKAMLPFKILWIADFCSLLASLIFYATVGYQFRPSADNPYFRLPQVGGDEENSIQMAERGNDD